MRGKAIESLFPNIGKKLETKLFINQEVRTKAPKRYLKHSQFSKCQKELHEIKKRVKFGVF